MKEEKQDDHIFVTCGDGLEKLVEEELKALGCTKLRPGFRGMYVEEASLEDIYRINYCSRIASRVLLPIHKFRCFDDKSLYRAAMNVDWSLYLPEGKTFAIDSNATHSKLRNSLYAAQVVKDAICDQLRQKRGSRPSIDTASPDVQLNLFIREPHGILSFDTSGAALHKRGYRLEGGEAPLQESLAAALLKIANFQGNEIVCDPCCGSGTLLIEAAMLATRTPPGYLRQKWGFMRLPNFSPTAWFEVKAQADKERLPLNPGQFFGCEVNKNTVRICKTNLRAAGFHHDIEIAASDFREYVPPRPPTFVITNPPHGRRLDDVKHLGTLYRSLGDFLKTKTGKPAKGFVFTGSLELTKEVGLAPKQRHVINNGGIDSRLLEFDLF
jgi:putative N6-adenine-specific DNA methylase